MTISPVHSGTMGQEIGEIWTAQMLLQPILPKPDRLLALITELRGKPVSFGVLRLCAAIFANRIASAADALSRSTDPCFIPPMLTRS